MKISLAAYQKELLRTGRDYGQLLMLWRRQGGKTTTFAWQALRWMLENPGTLVTFSTCSLALGSEMTEREAQLLSGIVEAIRSAAAGVGRVESNADGLDWFDLADLYQHNRLEVSLWHDRTRRSRTKIIAASYATARGYSGYVLLDEIGFIRDFKSFYEAIEPVFSRNPEYRLWMATTPPEDDAHFSYELSAYPPGLVFEPKAAGTWYQNESGLPVHRVSADDAEAAGVHLYDSRTRQPVTPAAHRAKALDKTAWDRNYGLVFTQGGASAVPLVPLHQAQALGAQLGCVFAEDELPEGWLDLVDPALPTAVGLDPATTEKEKSNPSGLCVLQEVAGVYVARLLLSYRTADPARARALLREVVEAVRPRALVLDATSERYWCAETKAELDPFCEVVLVVASERTEHQGESMTWKTFLGNLAVAAIEDRKAALPPERAVREDFRLVKRNKGGFDNALDNSGRHGDLFDGFKSALWGLLAPVATGEAEAVGIWRSVASAGPVRPNRLPDRPDHSGDLAPGAPAYYG
ncbi:MAG: terminase family protein [Kiritimatiellae bacterium]|nr:terminase family protein [Kiritimatiellia bacterium]